MKKILGLALTLASIGFTASATEAKSVEALGSPATTITSNAAAPQWRQDRWGRRNRRVQVFTTTRLVRYGRAIFRETYQVRQLPNGRTNTRLISRVRVR